MNAVIADSTPEATRAVRGMIHGYTLSQSVYLSAKLGLADAVGARTVDAETLARELRLHPGALYRLLRALASVGLFVEEGPRQFRLTPRGARLQSSAEGSLRAEAVLFGEEPYRACGELMHSLRTGDTAFDKLYGKGHFEYLAENHEAGHAFNEAMVQMTGLICGEVVNGYDFSTARTLVDVGGGYGVLLAAVLAANPELKGVLHDLPYAIAGARPYLEGRGVLPRIELIAGSSFAGVPEGGDLYLMKSVIHDWDDDRAGQLFRQCRKVVPSHGRLLVIERVIPADDSPFWGKFVDLVMLAMSGGRERTEAEYRSLLLDAGFELTRTVALPSGFSILEAAPLPGSPR